MTVDKDTVLLIGWCANYFGLLAPWLIAGLLFLVGRFSGVDAERRRLRDARTRRSILRRV